jgi:FkbM family methyltransferase
MRLSLLVGLSPTSKLRDLKGANLWGLLLFNAACCSLLLVATDYAAVIFAEIRQAGGLGICCAAQARGLKRSLLPRLQDSGIMANQTGNTFDRRPMPMKALTGLMRKVLERRGYYLQQRRALPYGVDYMLDIERLISKFNLPPVEMFFDVGANSGEVSLQALNRFPATRVVAFEPTASTFATLRDNLSRFYDDASRTSRASYFNLALGESDGTVNFIEYESSFYNSMVPNPPTPNSKGLVREVQCRRLDTFCREHGYTTIDVLKIDAEKCDLAVIKGASDMLAGRAIRFLYFEYNSVHGRSDATSLPETARYLEGFDYRIVATYIDRIDDPFFVVGNALFKAPQ